MKMAAVYYGLHIILRARNLPEDTPQMSDDHVRDNADVIVPCILST